MTDKRYIVTTVLRGDPLTALRFLETAHGSSGAVPYCFSYLLRCGGDAKKGSDPAQLPLRIVQHIFVTKQKKAFALPSGCDPAGYVVGPGSPVSRNHPSPDEIVNVRHERQGIFDLAVFSLKVIIGQNDIAGIPNNVDDSSIPWIEVFMTFDYPGSGNALKRAAGLRRRVWNQLFDVDKCNRLGGVEQICDQEPCPGVT